MTQQTHAQIIDAIAGINRQVRGIVVAYGSTNLPQSLTQFPAAMTLLGPEDYSKFGSCEYWIRVFVAPITANPATAYQQCLTLSTEFRTAYSALRGVSVGDRFVDRANLSTKMGFGNTGFAYTLKWGKSEFYGFSVNLPLMSSVAGT